MEKYLIGEHRCASTVHQEPDTDQVISVELAQKVVTVLIVDFVFHAIPVSSVTTIKVLVDPVELDTNARKDSGQRRKNNARQILIQQKDQVNVQIVRKAKCPHLEQ